MLYLIPTPIGNLEDITLRALRILEEVDVILAEDTRQTKKLINHYNIKTSVEAFHAHNEHKCTPKIIARLQEGEVLALVSDAGSPGISDPGYLLVNQIRLSQKNVNIIALPGATALIPALTASGLPCDTFHFEGFLPQKKGRQKRWKYLKELEDSIVIYESPYRIIKCLHEILEYWGEDKQVCLAREISKIHEEIITTSVKELLVDFKNRPSIKGEFVVIISKK